MCGTQKVLGKKKGCKGEFNVKEPTCVTHKL
jgi:hypothetical protein